MNISELRDSINAKIATLKYGEEPIELYEPIQYIMSLGGKRMRPLLALLGYRLFKDDWETALIPAIGVEVFHNFTLMHDDIMDKAPLRRGKPTVHKKWNENRAILSGDVMLIRAYDLMMEVDASQIKAVMQSFSRCAAVVCEGQQLDMNYEQLPKITEEEYMEMIRRKTAVLLGFSLELGGVLGGTDTENLSLLHDFGENIGIGFQLKDDWLDVYGDAEKFGKAIGGDIVANKKTFLLTKALEQAQGEDLESLNYWLNQTGEEQEDKVEAVTKLYNRLGIRELTKERMDYYFEVGFQKLEAIQTNNASQKALLRDFTEQIINREK